MKQNILLDLQIIVWKDITKYFGSRKEIFLRLSPMEVILFQMEHWNENINLYKHVKICFFKLYNFL